MKRKSPGEGILPMIDPEAAALFEESFLVLIDFGPEVFRHYVSQKPANQQQIIYDVLQLFDIAMKEGVK